jgi:predicted nucleic acid-binding protein
MIKTVVVDSDAIFALYNPNDPLNQRATRTFRKLIDQNCRFIYPTAVLFEIISLFQRVLPTPKVTEQLIDLIKQEELQIYVVDMEILKEATEIFKPSGSKKNTLIDCSVLAIAKKIKADGIFSYDQFYSKSGFKSAEDLL